jgi:septum formation protein
MIILASTSQTRRTLLQNAGIVFKSVSPATDETALIRSHPEWTATQTSQTLALAKALAVSSAYPTDLIVGADQVLSCNHKTYSKPIDLQDCREQLLALRGRSHHLISSVACARAGKTLWQCTQIATLTMRSFTEEFLANYIESQQETCTKSVGGYQLEGQGLQLFENVEGDYFTILGLPLLPLLAFLRTVDEIES